MKEEHILAYYRWDDRTHWKLDSMDRDEQPVVAYVSHDKTVFKKYATTGNVLWVIGLGPDGTPTLEARIAIENPFGNDDEGITVEGAADGSCFYGLNDASAEIMELAFVSDRQKWSLRERGGSPTWVPGHGKYLRAPRRIAAEGEETDEGYVSPGIRPFDELARRASDQSIFISWKHKDNDDNRQRFLRDLTVALTKLGYSVWLDQLALGGTEQIEHRRNKRDLMKRLLHQGLERCRAVVGVWTENYGESSTKKGENWTKGEWEDIQNARRLALVPGGQFESKAKLHDPDGHVPMPVDPTPDEVEGVAKDIVSKDKALMQSNTAR